MILGLGLIFFGMGVMGHAMEPLRSYPPFIDAMTRMENPLLGILVAAFFTALSLGLNRAVRPVLKR